MEKLSRLDLLLNFEGGSGGKLEIKDGEVRIRSSAKTRAEIRTKNEFTGERLIYQSIAY